MTDVRMPDNQKIRLCMGCMKQYDSRYDVCPYCGYFVQTPRRDASILEPGTILHGRYIAGKGSRHYDNDLHGMFGDGQTAMYIGWDCVEAKRVTIEEYFPSDLARRTQGGKLLVKPEHRGQFEQGLHVIFEKAEFVSKFRGVNGIIQVCDSFRENGTAYVLTEYKECITLKEYFTTRRPMWEDQVLNLTLGIASALNKVHQMGIGLFEIRSLYRIRVLEPDNRNYPDVELYDFHNYVQGVFGDWFLYWYRDHAGAECDLFQKQERDVCELMICRLPRDQMSVKIPYNGRESLCLQSGAGIFRMILRGGRRRPGKNKARKEQGRDTVE